MSSHSTDLDRDLGTTLRQRRVELRAAMSDLELALAAPSNTHAGRWAQQVRTALLGLETGLRDHVAVTEGSDGLHQELVATAPRLSGPVAELTAEHATLREQLVELLDLVGLPAIDARAVRHAGTSLLDLLMRHRQRGADLVFEAYEFDVGGSG
jgi:hypothetical protein